MDRYYVYILQCNDGTYYVGCTNDLNERLARHERGEAAKWTMNRRPVTLVYSEEHSTLADARCREDQIKGWSRVKKEKLILGTWIKL